MYLKLSPACLLRITWFCFAAVVALAADPKPVCSIDGSNMKMKVSVLKDANIKLIALGDEGQTDVCESDDVVLDSVTYMVLEISVDKTTRVQTVPVPATKNCYIAELITADTSLGSTEVKYYVAVQTQTDVLRADDTIYNITCDTATAGATTGDVTASLTVTNIVEAIGTTQVTGYAGTVTLALVQSDGTPITGPIDLDTLVKLQATFNIIVDPSYLSRGVKMYEVFVMDKPDGSGTNMPVINTDGCTAVTDSKQAFYTPTTFVWDGAPVTTKAVSRTGDLKLAVFTGQSTPYKLYFTAKFTIMCDDTTDEICFNQQAVCDALPSVRRKRSAVQSQLNGTSTTSVTVTLGKGQTLSLGGNDDKRDVSIAASCGVTAFWIVAIVLGVLLLLTLIFAVFLFYRLKMEQNKKDKVVEKYGAHNPSF